MLPRFMRSHAMNALTAGKYISVLKDCKALEARCPYEENETPEALAYKIFTKEQVSALGGAVTSACEWASDRVVKLFLGDLQLLERLKSMKRFFFHEQGDFIALFLDVAGEQLEQRARMIAPGRLKSVFEMVLRTTSANADPFKEDLTCELSSF